MDQMTDEPRWEYRLTSNVLTLLHQRYTAASIAAYAEMASLGHELRHRLEDAGPEEPVFVRFAGAFVVGYITEPTHRPNAPAEIRVVTLTEASRIFDRGTLEETT